MHIILVPSKLNGKRIAASISGRQLIAIGLSVVLLLPALVGFVTYRVNEMLERQDGGMAIVTYRDELQKSRVSFSAAREEATRHLNALAQRLGALQAQIMRLNALGTRLTHMAGLDPHEFNFDALPAMGGPEKNVSDTVSSPDVIKNMDTLTRDLERSQARLMALENLMLDRKLNASVTPSGWPVEGGWVSSGFGERMDPFTGHQVIHEGVDITGRYGGPIFATAEGLVSWVGEKAGYGLVVEVMHESGLVTRYAHTSAIMVKEGDRIKKGQQIALIGSSGRSTGPHLHFEVLRNGQPVDPSRFLKQAAGMQTAAAVETPR